MDQALIMWAVFLLWVNLPIWYQHRSLTHNQLTFHPILLTILKIMFWLTQPKYDPGLDKRAWVAIHRIHHRHSDTANDPHSPHVLGASSVILNRRRWYTAQELQSQTKNMIFKSNWIDRILMHLPLGRAVLLLFFWWLFSWPGLVLWLMCVYARYTHTFFNYACHSWLGYNNGPSLKSDRSRNVPYLMFLFLGEELHGNHHRWPGRCNLAVRWWEIDIGYWLLKCLSLVGLVKFNNS